MLKLKGNPKWDVSMSVFWGLVMSVVMFAFWYSMAGHPLVEYRFMKQGVVINAEVGECRQEVAENDSGQGGPYQHCGYSYEVNGNSYQGSSDFPQDVGETVEIIYLPDNPSVHREKVGAATGIFDFVFRKMLLGIVLLVMFVSPGIVFAYKGINKFRGKSYQQG